MLAKFAEYIVGLGKQSQATDITTVPSIPDKVFVRHGETYAVEDVPPPRRNHTVWGFADVTAAATDADMAKAPELYHDHGEIVVVLDRNDRRDHVTAPLIETDRLTTLQSLADGKRFTVRDAVKLLRFDLHGTGVDSVISAIRKIDFTRKSDGGASVDHGRETLGRSVEAAVQQADSIPEEFRVTTPVYSNPGLKDLSTVTVRCGVYLDMQGECIEIRVLADEIQGAICAAQTAIGDALCAALPGVPVFGGRP